MTARRPRHFEITRVARIRNAGGNVRPISRAARSFQDELEPLGFLNRQIARPGAAQDAIGVADDVVHALLRRRGIRGEAAPFGHHVGQGVNGGQAMPDRQLHQDDGQDTQIGQQEEDSKAGRVPADSGPTDNALWAADVWFSIKKHWVIGAQRLIRARRTLVPQH